MPPPVPLLERLVDRSFLEATCASSLGLLKVRMMESNFKSELAKIIPKLTKTVLHAMQNYRFLLNEAPNDRVRLAGTASTIEYRREGRSSIQVVRPSLDDQIRALQRVVTGAETEQRHRECGHQRRCVGLC